MEVHTYTHIHAYVPACRVPSPPRQHYEALPLAGWPAYSTWRPVPAFGPGMLPLLTKRLSQPLTVLYALQTVQTTAVVPQPDATAKNASEVNFAAVAQPSAGTTVVLGSVVGATPVQAAGLTTGDAAAAAVGPVGLQAMESLCVHVVGAGGFEVCVLMPVEQGN